MPVQQDLIARMEQALFADDRAVVGVQHIAVGDLHDAADLLTVQKDLFTLVSHVAALDVDVLFSDREADDLAFGAVVTDGGKRFLSDKLLVPVETCRQTDLIRICVAKIGI